MASDHINLIGGADPETVIGEIHFQRIEGSNLVFYDLTPTDIIEPLVLTEIHLSGAKHGIEFYIGETLLKRLNFPGKNAITIPCRIPLYLISKPLRLVLPYNFEITPLIVTYVSPERALNKKSVEKFTLIDKTFAVLNGEMYDPEMESVIRNVNRMSL